MRNNNYRFSSIWAKEANVKVKKIKNNLNHVNRQRNCSTKTTTINLLKKTTKIWRIDTVPIPTKNLETKKRASVASTKWSHKVSKIKIFILISILISNSLKCPLRNELSNTRMWRESWSSKKKMKNRPRKEMISINLQMLSSWRFSDGIERKREKISKLMKTTTRNKARISISFPNGTKAEKYWLLISRTSISKPQRFKPFLYTEAKRYKTRFSRRRRRRALDI